MFLCFFLKTNFSSPSREYISALGRKKKKVVFQPYLPLCCGLSNGKYTCVQGRKGCISTYITGCICCFRLAMDVSPIQCWVPVYNPFHKLCPQLLNLKVKFSPRKLKIVWRILSGHLKINGSGKSSTNQTTEMSFQREQGSLYRGISL